MTERFEHCPQQFFAVAPGGTLIYIGVKERAEFDEIALPCIDHGETEIGHVLSKSLDASGVLLVFQYWLKSLTMAARAEDLDKRKRAIAPPPEVS